MGDGGNAAEQPFSGDRCSAAPVGGQWLVHVNPAEPMVGRALDYLAWIATTLRMLAAKVRV